jgi:hypothetical protein
MFDVPAVPERYDFAVPAESWFADFMPNGDYTASGPIWFMQDKPLPMIIGSLVLDVDIQG